MKNKIYLIIAIFSFFCMNIVKAEKVVYEKWWEANINNAFIESETTMGILSSQVIPYKDDYVITSFKLDESSSKRIGTINIYDKNGNLKKSYEYENYIFLGIQYLDNKIYAVILNELDETKIIKLDSEFKEEKSIAVNFSEQYLIAKMYGMDLFKVYNDYIYILDETGIGSNKYDLGLNFVEHLTVSSNSQEICSVVADYCIYSMSSLRGYNGTQVTGADYLSGKSVSSGFNSEQTILLLEINEEEKEIFLEDYIAIVNPTLTEDYIIVLALNQEEQYEIVIVDYDGKIVQTIKEIEQNISIWYDESSSSFITLALTETDDCSENETCYTTEFHHFETNKITKRNTAVLKGNNSDIFTDGIILADNSIIAIGYTDSTDIEGIDNRGEEDALIVKYDENGNIIWMKNWGGNSKDSFVRALKISDKEFIVLANSSSTDVEGLTNKGSIDSVIIKYDIDGNIIWQKSFGGQYTDELTSLKHYEDGFLAIGFSSSNDIEGLSNTTTTPHRGIIIKYDFNGNIIWIKEQTPGVYSEYNDVVETNDGGYVLVGKISSSGGNIALIAKYDKNNNLIWEKKHPSTITNYNNEYLEVVELKDGSLIINGSIDEFDWLNPTILKYDKDGNLLWQKDLDMAFVASGLDLVNDDSFLLIKWELNTSDVKVSVLPLEIIFNEAGERISSEAVNPYENTSTLKVVKKGNTSIYFGGIYENLTGPNDAAIFKVTKGHNIKQNKSQNGTYEIIEDGNRAQIKINPDKGYELNTITITNSKGEELEYYEENGNYYFDLNNGVTVNVTYKKQIINPNTITFLKLGFITVIVFAIYNLFISKKLKVKRFA